MSSEWTIRVESRTEAIELKHFLPFLKEWKGMKRVAPDNRSWELDGGGIRLTYEEKMGGPTLFNTIHCTYSSRQSPEGVQRIIGFAEWAGSELGWPVIPPED